VVTRANSADQPVSFVGMEAGTINGAAGDDSLIDLGGAHLTLLGGPGNDPITIANTTGAVTADGRAGSDTYIVQFGSLGG
jgi:hypothetical protein